jgi:hypothetical protein
MNERPTTNPLATRPAYYLHPATHADEPVRLYTKAQLAAKRRGDARQVALWRARQAALIERNRRLRRFWLGFGAVTAVAVLAVIGVAAWLIWHTLAGLTVGALAVVAIVAGLTVGHRCLTVVQRWL